MRSAYVTIGRRIGFESHKPTLETEFLRVSEEENFRETDKTDQLNSQKQPVVFTTLLKVIRRSRKEFRNGAVKDKHMSKEPLNTTRSRLVVTK